MGLERPARPRGRDGRLLRRLGGDRQRRQACGVRRRCGSRSIAPTARCASRWPTTVPAARGSPAAGMRGMADRVEARRRRARRRQRRRRRDAGRGGDPVRVVIGEDQVLMREGLQLVLERAGFEIAGRRRRRRRSWCAASAPIGPISSSPTSGCRPTTPTTACGPRCELRAERAELPVIVLSQHVQRQYAIELLEGGARRRRLPAQAAHRRRRRLRRRPAPGARRRDRARPGGRRAR